VLHQPEELPLALDRAFVDQALEGGQQLNRADADSIG
jgi:hypothetical protein